jgi:hypothetical protein
MATRRDLTHRRPSAVRAFALGVVAAVLAVILIPFWLLWDSDTPAESKAFVATPQFVLWLFLFAAQAALWVGAAWLVISTLLHRVRDLRRRGSFARGTAAAIVGSTVVLALAPIVLLFGYRFGFLGDFLGHFRPGRLPSSDHFKPGNSPSGGAWPLNHHEVKVLPLVGTGLLIGILAIAGMWVAAVGLDDLALRASARVSDIRRFVALRSELTEMLAVAGVLIGFATLTTGALRGAVLASNDAPVYRQKAVVCLAERVKRNEPGANSTQPAVRARFDDLIDTYPGCRPLAFDPLYVLAYGLVFSGVLGMAFAPCFLSMREAGTRLRDATYPLPDPSDPTFFDVVEKRRKLDDYLQTNLSASATFKAGVAILTPLVAGLTSTLLSA